MAEENPMLAGAPKNDEQWASITYPKLLSAKLDGFRVLIKAQGAVTRKLLPLANVYTRNYLSRPSLIGLDGECLVADENGSISDPLIYNRTQSQLASFNGEPNFIFMVFDCFNNPDAPYSERLAEAARIIEAKNDPRIKLVQHDFYYDLESVKAKALDLIKEGYEGAMLRDPNGRYKHGRSTVKEQGLLKVKAFFMEANVAEEEAEIVGYEELESNRNLPETNLLGRSKRSSHKDNMIPLGTMGALVCRSPNYPETFKIGSGFTESQRQAFWEQREEYIGKQVTFKHQAEGALDKPRFPVFVRVHEYDIPDENNPKVAAKIATRNALLSKIRSWEAICLGQDKNAGTGDIDLNWQSLENLTTRLARLSRE